MVRRRHDVLNVDEKSGLVTAQKEGCSDVRAVADYADPMVFDPVMATVNVCVTELGEDEIAVNHLRVDMEEGETVTLKPLLPKKFKDATLTWGLEYGGAVILRRPRMARAPRSPAATLLTGIR